MTMIDIKATVKKVGTAGTTVILKAWDWIRGR
jgi:hypothetical protein